MFARLFAAAVALLVLSPAAHAGKVRIKNCLQERVFACSYNSGDTALTIAATAKGIKSGKTDVFKCTTKRCKVFAAVSGLKAANYTNSAIEGAAITGGTVGTSATLMAAGAAASGGTLVAATLGGAAVGAGVAFGIVKGLEGLKTGKRCEKIIKKAKKHKNGKRLKASGRVTLKAGMVNGTVSVVLVDGHVSCD